MNLADLKPAPYNPRKISKEALAGLSRSLHEFGDISGFTWNKRTGHLIAGHQRLDALKAEHDEALTLEQSNGGLLLKTPSDTFTIRVVDWPHAQEQAANIAANNPHIAGEFKQDALDKIIADLGQTDYAELLQPLRIDELLSPKALQVDEDEVPEPPEEAITKPGDLWVLGEHRVLCGDATKGEDVRLLLRDNQAHMCFTDPPWNVGIGQDSNPRHRQRVGLVNDDLSEIEFRGFLDSFAEHLDVVSGDIYCVLGASEWPTLDQALRGSGLHWSATIVWVKQVFVLGRSKYHRRYEPIWYGWRDTSSYCGDRSQDDVWQIDRPFRSEEHPTMKPVALVGRAMINSSRPGSLIYDPFLGSGTTLIAAEQLGRRCYGIEIEPRYVDVTVKRWEQLTGRKAER